MRACKGFVAPRARVAFTPYRTLRRITRCLKNCPNIPFFPAKTVDEHYSKHNLAFAPRNETCTSRHSSYSVLSMARSPPTTVASIVKKEVSLLKKGTGGKFLFPDVKLKVSTPYVDISGSLASRNGRVARRASEFSDGSTASITERVALC